MSISVRALDSLGDWTFGKGKNNYKRNRDAVAQDIQTRLNSYLGNCFFDTSAGIDWFNLLGAKDQTALNLAISATILNTQDVKTVLQLSSGLNSRTRRFTVQYTVSTIYGNVAQILAQSPTSGVLITTQDGFILTTEDGTEIST